MTNVFDSAPPTRTRRTFGPERVASSGSGTWARAVAYADVIAGTVTGRPFSVTAIGGRSRPCARRTSSYSRNSGSRVSRWNVSARSRPSSMKLTENGWNDPLSRRNAAPASTSPAARVRAGTLRLTIRHQRPEPSFLFAVALRNNLDASNLHPVTGGELGDLGALAVDERPVGAFEVTHLETAIRHDCESAVDPRDERDVKDEVGACGPAHGPD